MNDRPASARHGLRGYIGSRSYYGSRAPQHVQNLVIRNFCTRLDKQFLLSATEYAMENCYMMLERVFDELPSVEGVVLYSLFMMPAEHERRAKLWDKLRRHGGTVYAAVEDYTVQTEDDIQRIETIWRLHLTMPHCPKGIGRHAGN
ncbi:sporadic carbohydrate cluster protein, TIGR04323 family [Thalassospiraceae bacterium LMO-JJ14]|nr:sporadic carbohydrate cluster protein, TIGR04323 family [Thalassospiraceae bacterium LMO-JJ14]